MKKNSLLYIVCILVLTSVFACSEDTGNYDYSRLNEVTIDSIEAKYVKESGSRLKIEPYITNLDEENADLSYSWTIGQKEVSTERVLDIDLPPLDYTSHLCALTVTDNVSGMQYRQTFDLEIVNAFNYGYYFLTRKEDGATELAYIQARDDAEPTLADIKYATGCGEYTFGKEPSQIYGVYGYDSSGDVPRWTMTFLTKEGEAPAITTDNLTFEPSYLLSDQNFIEQNEGYVFKPEMTMIDMGKRQFFLSDGQFIFYTNGKLYRPALHDKEYRWCFPACGGGGAPAKFAWAYDELTNKCYVITPYTVDNPGEGIYANEYAYDRVMEPEGNKELKGKVFASTDMYAGTHKGFFFSAAEEGIYVYSFTKDWLVDNPLYVGEQLFPFAMQEGPTVFALGSVGAARYYAFMGNGHSIYSTYLLDMNVTEWLKLPEDLGLGSIQQIGLSALNTRMVVVLYDENSAEERKGSVIFVDYTTKQITHTFPHVLHECVSFLGGNASTSIFGYGEYGDNK